MQQPSNTTAPPVTGVSARPSIEQEPGITEFDQTFPATTYTRLAGAVRLVACFASMHIAFFYDSELVLPMASPLALVAVLFSIYAAVLYWCSVRDKTYQERQFIYWFDVLWYLAIIIMTGGHSSHFVFFLSFPLLFISLRWGFKPGITMTVFASLALTISSVLGKESGALFNAGTMLPPLGLLVLGYLMATWANSDLTLNRRLASLRAFNALFNPRFNLEQLIDRVVRHLANIYSVDSYVLVIREASRPPKVFRADLPAPMYQVSDATAQEISNLASVLNPAGTLIYGGKRGLMPAAVFTTESHLDAEDKLCNEASAVAERFDCVSFGSLYFVLRNGAWARLFVWANRHYLTSADLPFFHQLGEQMMPRIENVQLLDRLASEVAEAERHKISRDVHDSAIQPYIGLKFGLEALARKVPAGHPLADDVARMVKMAANEITELRSFVKGLRGDGDPGRSALVPALGRQAARFTELYGITVDLDSPSELHISDRLATEVFHMVGEALSNVRRHTAASRAHIKLACDADTLTLRVANPLDEGVSVKLFTPRSIVERAYTLGGTCRVESDAGRDTVVVVEIPLERAETSA